ncbi:hypothetical protein [Inquilinus sp. Marseille-Q2685]|uniref:hypothetical protein n=1 Tax=Inquilinus sp. Marseille-Q2685 TaxID=2866581 RepID=UPI001CE3FC3F|nr:hypothetical protein [Inquilinus sp. Marseille-Q2685]
MTMAQTDADSGEARPSDPDLNWTGWALEKLREVVEIDARCKRLTERQQQATPAGSETPSDFPLMQSRLSRSIRLSIAMAERIRGDYLHRRAEGEASGALERRRRRREQAVQAVVEAVGAAEAAEAADPAAAVDPEETERLRSEVWERLTEDEVLDVQLDTLPAGEFVREVCRWLGRRLDPSRLPQGWDDVLGANDNAGSSGDGMAAVAMASDAGDGWPEQPDESEDGRPPPGLPKPDSS